MMMMMMMKMIMMMMMMMMIMIMTMIMIMKMVMAMLMRIKMNQGGANLRSLFYLIFKIMPLFKLNTRLACLGKHRFSGEQKQRALIFEQHLSKINMLRPGGSSGFRTFY